MPTIDNDFDLIDEIDLIFNIGMENCILIKGGVVVNATGSEQADVLIEDRIIKQVGTDIQVPEGARIIDATDKLVMPGKFYIFHFCIQIQSISLKSLKNREDQQESIHFKKIKIRKCTVMKSSLQKNVFHT